MESPSIPVHNGESYDNSRSISSLGNRDRIYIGKGRDTAAEVLDALYLLLVPAAAVEVISEGRASTLPGYSH